jgi:hypothetical protein
MRFMRLTLRGAFDSLQSENRRNLRPEAGARPGVWSARPMRWAAWLALGLGLAGCVGISVDSAPDRKQKVVAERAQARWDLLMKGEVDAAYQFLSTGSKAATPLGVFKTKIRPGGWREAKVGKIECEAEICKVMMLITYDTRRMKGIETPLDETWIIENGSAWYVYR